ncbi:MAG: ATP-dependent Clp protease adaptor ClpS [Fimbriimonadaceae bacterium]
MRSDNPTIAPDKIIEQIEQIQEKSERDWIVTVYNNETNTYEEVISVLMVATGCDLEEAALETWEIDHLGQCVVHRSSADECQRAADIISTIGIHVEATPED